MTTMTEQDLLIHVLARQRDGAMNAAAKAEVAVGMLQAQLADLQKRLDELTPKQQPDPPPDKAPADPEQARH